MKLVTYSLPQSLLESLARTLQMAAISLTPWSLLAFLLGPDYYQCWWFARLLNALPIGWQFQLPEDWLWCPYQPMSDFEFNLLLSGTLWIPPLALLTGWWCARNFSSHRLLGIAGVVQGLWFYFSVSPTFFLDCCKDLRWQWAHAQRALYI